MRELGFFSLEKRKLQGDLIMTFQYKRRLTGKVERLLTTACSDRTRRNGFKLEEESFRLDIRKKFFTQRVVRHWHGCPESCGCPIPGGAQDYVGWGPGQPKLEGGSPAHGRGWGGLKEVPSSASHSVIL